MVVEQEKTTAFPGSAEDLTQLMRDVCREEIEAEGKERPDLNTIRQALKNLTRDESDRELEVAISGFANTWAASIITGKNALLTQLLPTDDWQPKYGTDDEWIAFTAFAVAVNYQRLQKNPNQEGDLLKKYEKYFGKKLPGKQYQYEHMYFFHLDVLHRMDLVVSNSSDQAFLERLLRDAERNRINLNNNRGGDHAFAEAVALVFENTPPELRKYFEESPDNWLEKASEAASDALRIKYAKFYCTRGRIRALRGELRDAIADVNTAIALENNARKDYFLRIGQYNSYYQQFLAKQNMNEQKVDIDNNVLQVTQQIEQREDDIARQIKVQEDQLSERMLQQEENFIRRMEALEKETMAKNMEFLGLFSGIVSFTIGSLTLASNFKSEDALKIAGLIVVLLGALMCVFSAFGMILHGFFVKKKDKNTDKEKQSFIWRHIVVFILGALIVIGGIVFCIK